MKKIVYFIDSVGDINIYRTDIDSGSDEATFYFVDSEGNVLRRLCVFIDNYDPVSVYCDYYNYK